VRIFVTPLTGTISGDWLLKCITMMFQLQRSHSVEYGRMWVGSVLVGTVVKYLDSLRKTMKTSVKVVRFRARIWSRYTRN